MAFDGSIRIDTSINGHGFQEGLKKITSTAVTGLSGAAAALGTLGALAVKTGIDFESAFAGVKKTVDATPVQFDAIHDSLIGMSKDIPQSATALSSIAEAAGQLGIKTDSIIGFTKVMADMGVTTNMGATEAATSLARLANITQMPQTEFDRLGSVIVALGNNLATTEGEITAMALRIAGAGHQVGMSEAQILSFSGALSSVGIESEAGGTAISTLLTKMSLSVATGGKDLANFATVAGMTGDAFRQAFEKDAAGAVLSFIEGLARTTAEGGSAIKVLDDIGLSDIRMRDAMLRAAGASNVFSDALAIGSEAWSENTALTEEAEQRYSTMESRLSLLKNGVQALGIAFYESTDEDIGGAVSLATEYIGQLSAAFGAGGLQGLVAEVGTVFSDLAVHIAQAAPAMLDAASEMLRSFIAGIQHNLPQLADSALAIVSSLVKGIADVFPRAISQPVKEAMDALVKSFQSGGLRTAISTLKNIIQSLGDVAGNLAKTVLPLLTKAVDMLGRTSRISTPLIVAAVTAVTAWKVAQQAKTWVTLATKAVEVFTVANTAAATASTASTAALALSQAAYGVVTGKLTLATAAQALFNAVLNANPIGLAVTAIAALTAGIVALTLASEDNQTAAERDLALAQEQHAAIQQQAADYDKLKSARFESAQADLIGIDYTKQLADELMHLADSSGYVQDADRDRANFLLGALNQALGTEYSMTGNVIDQYGKLTDSVYAVISAKRAEILLSAQEDAYREAILKRGQAQSDAANAKIAMDQEQIAVDELTAQHIQELADLETLRALGASASTVQQQSEGQIVMSGWYAELEARKATLAEQQAAYADASGTAKKYHDDIATYESAAALISSGNTTQAIADMERKNAAYLTANDVVAQSSAAQQELLGQQYANQLTQLNDYITNYKAGTEGYTLAGVEALQASAAQCGAEAEKAGAAIVDGQITGIDGKKIPLEATIKSLGDNGIKVLGTFVPSFKEQGVFACQGYIDGVRSKKQAVYDVWAEVTSFGKQGVSDTQQSGSPAKKFIEQGEFGGQGYVVGLQREAHAANAAGAGLGTAALAGAAAFNASFVQRMRAQVQRTQESIAFNAAARNEAVYASAAAPPPAPATKSIQFGDVNLYASPGASESEMSRVLEDYETRSDWGIK